MNSSLDSKVFPERLSSGLYKRLSDQIIAAKTAALANAEYKKTFHRETLDWTKNYSYVDASGRSYMPVIFGEICSSALGTKMSAKGTFFSGGDKPKFITDNTNVKDALVLGPPTCATKNLAIQFNNQIAALNEVFQDDDKLNTGCSEGWNPKEWVRTARGAGQEDMLVLTTLPKYIAPDDKSSKTSSKSRITRQALEDPSSDVANAEVGPSVNFAVNTAETVDAAPSIPNNADRKVGDVYDPRLLPDYGGSLFQHKFSKLVQLDIRNADEELVYPWNIYDELRPGTLIIARTSLHCFWMKQPDNSMKQIYQINAHSIKILSKSDLPMEIPPIPDNNPTTKRKASSQPVPDDGDLAFSSFSPKKLRLQEASRPSATSASKPVPAPQSTGTPTKNADSKDKGKAPATGRTTRAKPAAEHEDDMML